MSNCKIGAYLSGAGNATSKIQQWRNTTKTTPKIVCEFHRLDNNFRPNTDNLKLYSDLGIIPFLKLEPWDGLKPVIKNKYSAAIENMAKTIKDIPGEVRISLGHEMNVPKANAWYPWQGVPGEYKEAFNFFAEKLYKHGANNAKLVYNVNEWDPSLIQAYYPGDANVHYLAVDGYNWGPTQSWGSEWRTFSSLFYKPIRILQLLSPNKPIMIGEFASTEIGGDKSIWIRDALQYMKINNIESFIWFDIAKEQDWRIASSENSILAAQETLNDPHFIQGLSV